MALVSWSVLNCFAGMDIDLDHMAETLSHRIESKFGSRFDQIDSEITHVDSTLSHVQADVRQLQGVMWWCVRKIISSSADDLHYDRKQ